MTRMALLLPCLVALNLPAPALAQPLGTFRWQLQPHCNVVSLSVTQVGGQYRLEGTDDQCGSGRDRAAVVGMAFPNADGSIGFGLTIVTAPGGVAVHVDAEIAIPTLSGTWRDSSGGAGTFALTPGPATGGTPRPAPPAVVPPAISLLTNGGIVASYSGTSGGSPIPASGAGVRMMWYPGKAAFRAGRIGNTQWDDINIGRDSVALGANTEAAGEASTAIGHQTAARAAYSTAMGDSTTADGPASTAMGTATTATGESSTAMGLATVASGHSSTAIGQYTKAAGDASLAIGNASLAGGTASFAGGFGASSAGNAAFAFGDKASASGVGSFALGQGARTTTSASGSFVFADRSTSNAFESFSPNEFGARFAGGIYLYTRADLSTGSALAANGSSWAALSDANAKENFREVDGEELLAKLADIPIREWNYKAQGAGIRHMGPTAQDFGAAFGLGDFPLRINTIDADGVALAGVKALEARTRALGEENAALRAALARLSNAIEELRAEGRAR
jgi:hypothetical protein